jgi:ribosomal protein S18 acetylase RimI-like enzyme
VEAPFCLPLKIEDGNSVLAVGSLILHADTGWLAHIIVAPEQRRQGLGTAITGKLIANADSYRRTTLLLVATAVGAPLYERLGFRQSYDYSFYSTQGRREAAVSPLVRALDPLDAADVFELDRRATGEDRRLLLARARQRGWVCAGPGKGELRGYYLPDLGEGTIMARDAEAGAALMAVRLATTDVRPVVPAGNDAANEFLRASGFELQSSAARMVRHGDDPMVPSMVFNRVGGHLG